jgi:hypothetical protein
MRYKIYITPLVSSWLCIWALSITLSLELRWAFTLNILWVVGAVGYLIFLNLRNYNHISIKNFRRTIECLRNLQEENKNLKTKLDMLSKNQAKNSESPQDINVFDLKKEDITLIPPNENLEART